MEKRTQFEEMILAKSYSLKYSFSNTDVLDILDKSGQFSDLPHLKNVCAKVSTELSDQLEEVCSLLTISKRRFIEAALIEALKTARLIMNDEVDIFEHTIESEVQ
jgi:hypothetical protein